MENIKGFIFDLDGVIVSTDKYHYLAWKKLADKIGVYFDENINNRLKGVSRMKSLEIVLEKSNKIYSEKEKLELANIKNNYYIEFLEKLSENDILDGVYETLKVLKEKEYKLAIGSSSKNAKLILNKIGYIDVFNAISDGNNITHSKPDPEVFLKASEMLSLSPKECIVVEDASAGIDAGLAGGFLTIGIGDAGKYEKTNYKINYFQDILKIVNDNIL